MSRNNNVTLTISLPETLMRDLRFFAAQTGTPGESAATAEDYASEIVAADLAEEAPAVCNPRHGQSADLGI